MRRIFASPAGLGRLLRAAGFAGALAMLLALLPACNEPVDSITADPPATVTPTPVPPAPTEPAPPTPIPPTPTEQPAPPTPPPPTPTEPAVPTDPVDYGQPNLIFIMADDLGRNLLSRYDLDDSVEINTPNIDRLADEGVLFKNAWATPLCLVTRAELITGQYPFNNGMIGHTEDRLIGEGQLFLDPKYHRSFAQPLRQAGYATAMAGKWHGNDIRPGLQPRVLAAFGFNEWMTADPDNRAPTRAFTHDGGYEAEGFPPDVLADFVIDFIARHRSQPFFVYYPMHLVHHPLVATPLRPDAATDTEKLVAMTEYADHLVGRLLLALEEMGLRENTIIFFSGDNGTAVVQLDRGPEQHIRADGKGKLTEAGINVPLIVSGGPVARRGETDALTDFTDVMPTLAEFAGVALPDEYRPDGQSLARFLTGRAKVSPRQWIASAASVWPSYHGKPGYYPFQPKAGADRYFWHSDTAGIVLRDRRFKLWHYPFEPPALFDLRNDPQEEMNIWNSANPVVVQARRNLAEIQRSLPRPSAPLRLDPIAPTYGLFAHWRFDRQTDMAGASLFPDTIGGYDALTAAAPAGRPGQFGSALPLSASPTTATGFARFFNYNKNGFKEADFSSFTLSAWVNLAAEPAATRRLLSQPDHTAIIAGLRQVIAGVEQDPPLDTTVTGHSDGDPYLEISDETWTTTPGGLEQLTMTVTASDLDPAHEYMMRVVYGSNFSSLPGCAYPAGQRDSAFFTGRASHTATFTLYACAEQNTLLDFSVTSQGALALQLGTAVPDANQPASPFTAGLRRVVNGQEQHPPLVISTDQPSDSGPRLRLLGVDQTPPVGEAGQLTVAVSNLNPSHDYLVRVVYGDLLASTQECRPSDTYNTSEIFSGQTAYSKSFTVYGCEPDTGAVASTVETTTSDAETVTSVAEIVNLAEWTHVAATWDGRSNACGTAILYVNGQEVSRACLGNELTRAPANDLTLGQLDDGAGGYLDDVAVWRQPLTPAQVAALHTLGRDFGYDAAAVDTLFNVPRDYTMEAGGRQWQRTDAFSGPGADGLAVSAAPDGTLRIQFGSGIAVRSAMP